MPESTAPTHDYTGLRIARWRDIAGLSQQQLADRMGVTQPYISHVESGRRPVSTREQVAKFAAALGVSVTDLTAQPVQPRNADELVFYSLAPTIRQALDGERPLTGERTARQLLAAVQQVEAAQMGADWPTVAAVLPDLLAELDVAHGEEERMLYVRALSRAALCVNLAGYADLARRLADRAADVADKLGSPAHRAGAAFALGQAALAGGSSRASLTIADYAANDTALSAANPTDRGLRGMLHLHAALSAAALGQPMTVSTHLAEATDLASVPADSWGMEFGVPNVAVWRVAIACDLLEWGNAPELAALVDQSQLSSRDRRARLYVDAGRGWYETGRQDKATEALLTALSISPHGVRVLPCVRELVAQLARDAGPRGGSEALHRLVTAVGVDPLET